MRLWITEPARATCLAAVTAVKGDWFSVDRALFAPRSTAFRHPQYADKGTVWIDGDKRRLAGVQDRGEVWYRLQGTVPAIGDELNCQLDQETRHETARTHTAMHLTIAALQQMGAPPMVADCEVKGGGHFRLTYAMPVPRQFLAAALKRVKQQTEADTPVQQSYASRDEAMHYAHVQEFQPPDPLPGGDPVPLVTAGDACFPCDGSHVDRTGRIGAVAFVHAQHGKDGFVVVGQVSAP